MVIQLGRNSTITKNIKSALKAKPGITSEGNHHGPLIFATFDHGGRRPSGLQQGMPYSNRDHRPPQTTVNNLTSSPQREFNISKPQRPSTEHHYQYSSRSGKMEKIY
jgi:hypothetical protein